MDITKVERKPVPFFEGLKVDGYRMPSGDFRVGLTGASEVLGYGKNWLGRVLSEGRGLEVDGGKIDKRSTLAALRKIGFTEQVQRVEINPIKGGGSEAETISLDDFNRLIAYAVSRGKKAALALQLSLTMVALNDFFRDAFGEPPLSIEQKRELFYKTYASTISPEHWREMDREDILRLALDGDEPHLRGGRWNAWNRQLEDYGIE